MAVINLLGLAFRVVIHTFDKLLLTSLGAEHLNMYISFCRGVSTDIDNLAWRQKMSH